MRLTARIAIAACALLLATSTTSPSVGEEAQPETPSVDAPREPTILSVLSLAKDIIETAKFESSHDLDEVKSEVIRIPLRHLLALTMRKTGYEPAFDDYVGKATAAWEVWDPSGSSPEGQARRKSESLTADARLAFFSGDPDGARSLLFERPCEPNLGSPISDHCVMGDFAIHIQFLKWDLEVRRVSAALRRVDETNWDRWGTADLIKAGFHREFVEALIDVGRVRDALDFLAKLRSGTRPEKSILAQTYWHAGAVQEAQELMREVVAGALVGAETDPQKPFPTILAGIQILMGDRDGGIGTLRRVRQYSNGNADRVRAPLAGYFALAGLDDEAFSLLDGTSADREILATIIIGKARRGDFETALQTLDKLRELAPEPLAGLPQISVFTDSEAVISIVRNAARAGDTNVLRRALVAYGEMRPPGTGREAAFLRDLARVGKAQDALEFALGAEGVEEKILNLCMVAEGLAGLPDPNYRPLTFQDTW